MATTSTLRSDEVIRRRWTPDPQGLLELWQHEAPRTERVFRAFEEHDLTYRPQQDARSVGELLQHVIASYALTSHWLRKANGTGLALVPVPRAVKEAVTMLEEQRVSLFDMLSSLAPAAFLDDVAPFGVRESRAVMALGMLKHEIHHRGELYTLARVCGRKPPHLYQSAEAPG